MAILIDPWKGIDPEKQFDYPENIFEIHGDIKLPLNNDVSCLSIGAHIKRIYMLTK